MILYLPPLLILLLLSGFFSSSETAFLTLERVRLDHLVRERRPGAARVSAMLERPGRLLSAILLGNNLVNTGAAAVGTVIAAQLVSGGQAALVATLVITALLVVFGEVAPKTVSLQHSFALTRWYARPIAVWAALMRPLVAALDTLSRGMLTLVGAQRGDDRALTLGELRTAITLGAESGALREEASDMMLGALALQQQQARSIMVHRVNMVTPAAGDSVAIVAGRMAEHGYLRLPVYVDGPDDIVGYVHVSDVNAAYAGSREQTPCAR